MTEPAIIAHFPARRAVHGLHTCRDCRGRIARGDRYSDQRLSYDGSAYTWREHALCRALFEWAWSRNWLNDGDTYDSTDGDLPDWWAKFVAVFAPGAS